jgi:hypothetical protein
MSNYKYHRAILAFIIALSILSIAAVNTAPRSPFKGVWRAIDLDGSNIQLVIAGGGRGVYRLNWTDDYWSICNGLPGNGKGKGFLDSSDPNILHTDWVITCTSLHQSYFYQFDAIYDPISDTFVFQDVVWSRVGH